MGGEETIQVELPPQKRLDIFLTDFFNGQFSRSQIQKWFSQRRIKVEQIGEVKPSFKAKQPATVFIAVPSADESSLSAIDLKLPIIFENSDFAVINKPAGVTVHPGAGTHGDTIANGLLSQFEQLSDINGNYRPGIVHRLDRETCGLLLIAKNNLTHRRLAQLFHDRKIEKSYTAWVKGETAYQNTRLEGFISRDPRNRVKMMFHHQPQKYPFSKQAALILTTKENTRGFSLLDIRLLTGRTHQIRATLQSLRHPIVFDQLYGFSSRKKNEPNLGILLQAYRLQFELDELYRFEIEQPESFLFFQQNMGRF